jgi:hypothetical protein
LSGLSVFDKFFWPPPDGLVVFSFWVVVVEVDVVVGGAGVGKRGIAARQNNIVFQNGIQKN